MSVPGRSEIVEEVADPIPIRISDASVRELDGNLAEDC
jgi:hypothetical protein